MKNWQTVGSRCCADSAAQHRMHDNCHERLPATAEPHGAGQLRQAQDLLLCPTCWRDVNINAPGSCLRENFLFRNVAFGPMAGPLRSDQGWQCRSALKV